LFQGYFLQLVYIFKHLKGRNVNRINTNTPPKVLFYNGHNLDQVLEFCKDHIVEHEKKLFIVTHGTVIELLPNCYVIKESSGFIWLSPKDEFEKTKE
jgi:hypothetical protein